jgi:hypothetical protein
MAIAMSERRQHSTPKAACCCKPKPPIADVKCVTINPTQKQSYTLKHGCNFCNFSSLRANSLLQTARISDLSFLSFFAWWYTNSQAYRINICTLRRPVCATVNNFNYDILFSTKGIWYLWTPISVLYLPLGFHGWRSV